MGRIRVLVVDDSVVVRRLVTDALSSDPVIDVVGVAANGQIALAKVETLNPDVVTMDIEMPVLDGIQAVRELRRTGYRGPIIMFSTLSERGASATLDALAAGANDYVTKPSNVGSVRESLEKVATDLIPRIKALVPHSAGTSQRSGGISTAPQRTHPPVTLRRAPATRQIRAVVIGSSTGGPEALARVLSGLPRPLPVPVVIVQHMPPVFTRQLAARLARTGPSEVLESAGGETLIPGKVYIAPGDHHLVLRRSAAGVRTALTDGPPVNFCRPAVDVLFSSAAEVFGGDLLGVVLTGMGSDGRSGAQSIITAGGTVFAQDEASSVVWGMPGAVATAGLAHLLLPLDDVAAAITRATAAAGGNR